MIDTSAVLAVFSVYIVGVMIPGPNFVAVAHKAVSAPRLHSFALASGIVTVSLFWATCAILGIGIVFAIFPWLAEGIKIAGALYLVWFGIRLITNSGAVVLRDKDAAERGGFQSAYVQGLATNIANPKSIAFFAAVFSSATPAHVSTATFFAMLLTVLVTASCWWGFVVAVLSQETVAAHYRAFKKSIDRACGAAIIFLGIRQLVSR